MKTSANWTDWAESEAVEIEVLHAGEGWISMDEHCRRVEAEQAAAKAREEV